MTDLLSKEYAADQKNHIDPDVAGEVRSARPPESGDTTYFCIVDCEGGGRAGGGGYVYIWAFSRSETQFTVSRLPGAMAAAPRHAPRVPWRRPRPPPAATCGDLAGGAVGQDTLEDILTYIYLNRSKFLEATNPVAKAGGGTNVHILRDVLYIYVRIQCSIQYR